MKTACDFLDSLPREIRNQIYADVLAPTGRAALILYHRLPSRRLPYLVAVSSDPVFGNEYITLSLLRTCRQINKEASPILWQENALVLTRLEQQEIVLNRLDLFSWNNLVKIELHRKLPFEDTETWVKIKQRIHDLRTNGSLRELHLILEGLGLMAMFSDCTSDADTKKTVCDALRGFNESDGDRKLLLELSLNLDITYGRLSKSTLRMFFEASAPERCDAVLSDLHTAIGGPVSLDGVLCYKDGLRIRHKFKEIEDVVLGED